MEQANQKMIEITEFLRNLNFKKKGGGVDREDVLDKIEQLTVLYHALLEEQSEAIEYLQGKNQALTEQVQTPPPAVNDHETELNEANEKIRELTAELDSLKTAYRDAERRACDAANRQERKIEAPIAPPPPPDKTELTRAEFYVEALKREISALETRRSDLERNLQIEVRALEAIRRMREEHQHTAQAEQAKLRESLRVLREECLRVIATVGELDDSTVLNQNEIAP
jgi:chromosome segregation ATPase